MSIEKIKSKLEGGSFPKIRKGYAISNRSYLKTGQDSVNFTGAATAAVAAGKPLEKYLLEKMPWIARAMVKLHEGMGEVQNQLINACGTGLVAPLFIMYNPLSDKDQDTKTYTAMRQPISAVLAVATQAAIVIPFNAMIKNDADIGYLPMEYNRTLFPSDDFIEKLVKKENPGKKFVKNKDVDELKDAIAAYKKEHYEKPLVEMIENDKIVFNTTDGKNKSTLEMPKDKFSDLFKETIDEIINEEQAEKVNTIQNKLPKKIERGIFYHTNSEQAMDIMRRLKTQIDFGELDFEDNKQMLEDAHKNFNKECKKIIKELKKATKKHPENETVNEGFIKIIKEVKKWNNGKDETSLRVLQNKLIKQVDLINKMKSMDSTKDIINYVKGSIDRRTDAIDGSIRTLQAIKTKLEGDGITVKEAQAIIDAEIDRSNQRVRRQVKISGSGKDDIRTTTEWIDSTAARLTEKAKSIAKCIAKRAEKHATSYIDGLKRWTGLGVSLAILPVTCWLLNRIYPWFMDKAFPGLSNPKPKDANSDKKVEVA